MTGTITGAAVDVPQTRIQGKIVMDLAVMAQISNHERRGSPYVLRG